MKTINILGENQREQWHTIVRIIRKTNGRMSENGLNALCDELDRYIDHAEDVFDELRKEEYNND